MKSCVVIFFFLSFLSSKALAWGLKDLGEEAASPWTTTARYALLGGTALTVTILLFEDQLSDPFQVKQDRNKTLGDSSRWGDWMGQWIPNVLYIGGFAVAGHFGNPKGYHRALGMFKASTYATVVTTALKYTVKEPRPIDWHWRTSFPSGHTTTAFAFSGYVMAEHEYWLGIPALILSTFIGYSRINDNKHWLHDVTAGATIGWVYGWGISRLQLIQRMEKSQESVFYAPIIDRGTYGLAMVKEF